MGESRTVADDNVPTAASPDGSSLDDAAALLVGLSPEDADELARVRDLLIEAAGTESFPLQVRNHATVAAEKIGCLIVGKILDPEAALAETGHAVELALGVLYGTEKGESASGQETRKAGPSTSDATPPDHAGSSSGPGTGTTEGQDAPWAYEGPASEGFASSATLPEDTDLNLLSEFVAEAMDHMVSAEAAILALETNPDDSESINTIFRAFHTVKGTSAFLGLTEVQRLGHLAENLLASVREGHIRLTGGSADLALEACDALKSMIEALDGAGPGAPLTMPPSYEDLCRRLDGRLADPEGAGGVSDGRRLGDILVADGKATREDVEAAAREHGDVPIGEALVRSGVASPADVERALRGQVRTAKTSVSDATVRVSTDRLDSLVNAVGELVIVQSMIAQDPDVSDGASDRLARNVAQADKITRELQYVTISLRMVPLRATFRKMARLVRDLARKSGKAVRFLTEGEDTEIDRNMVETLNDPLVHMIRNAVDHGIEPADVRRGAGKRETGTVALRAYHSAGSVVIELADDGRGLDRDGILARAVERGLVDGREAGRDLSDDKAFALIFRPGFSTARKVTSVSGRGVGMDVVRRKIEALHGRVGIASRPGAGSTFTLRLPLTTAITDAMILRVGRERYLLPTLSIVQSFRPGPGDVSTVVGRGEMAMLRGDLIAVVRLARFFEIAGAVTDPCEGLLVVVEADGRRAAVLVDELLGQQQVVVKALGEGLGQVRGVSGGTILGDGRVGLILDPAGLLRLADGGEDRAGGQGPAVFAEWAHETALAMG